MHELSLCQSAVEIIVDQAHRNNAKRVTAVWLVTGAFSCIEQEALRFSFECVCRNTIAQNCALHIINQPGRGWCWDCSQEVEMSSLTSTCPQCGGCNMRPESGDDLQIKDIEIE